MEIVLTEVAYTLSTLINEGTALRLILVAMFLYFGGASV
jgi:hypothetical protein